MRRYERRILVSGIVYVHRIVDPITPTSRHNFLMFAKLTRYRSTENVVLATTMWDILGPSFDVGRKREEGLKVEFWSVMIPHHVAVKRFLNTSDSAWSIVDSVVKNNDQKKVLSMKKKRVFRNLIISILRAFMLLEN